MQPQPLRRAELALLIGVPLGWAVLLLFHPTGDGDEFYPVVGDQVARWMVVHLGSLVFIPLLAVAIYLLLRGVDGAAARVSRAALVGFVLFYGVWEALVGVGLGLLANEVNGLAASEQAAGAKVLEEFADDGGVLRIFELIGTSCLLVALIAAGIALRRHAGAPLAVPVLLVLAAIPIAWHVPPFGQFGLVLLTVAALLSVRARDNSGLAPSSPAGAAAA